MDHKSFIKKVSEIAALDIEDCSSYQEALTELMESTLASGDSISIPSFGNFEPRKRKERVMSNPAAKGKRFLVPPKLVVSFKPSTVLKNKINNVPDNE